MPMTPPAKEAVLFVQSDRVIDDVFQRVDARLYARPGESTVLPPWNPGAQRISNSQGLISTQFTDHNRLPEDEAECVYLVWKVAHEQRIRVHMVDVASRSKFHELWEVHVKHLTEFPVLVRWDRQRLSGMSEFTEGNLRHFLSA